MKSRGNDSIEAGAGDDQISILGGITARPPVALAKMSTPSPINRVMCRSPKTAWATASSHWTGERT
ncbi:hypothetical protein QZH46_00405 [Pseudomonas corrugata]